MGRFNPLRIVRAVDNRLAPAISSVTRIGDPLAVEVYYNNSTVTTDYPTTTSSTFIETWIVVMQMFHEAYIYPVFIIASLLANLLIIGVFLRPAASKQCGAMTRIYYLLIAVADLANVIESDLIINFGQYGLSTLTHGALSWDLGSASHLNCALSTFITFSSIMISGFTLFVFSLERAYVVVFPFRARGTSRVPFFACLLVVCFLFSLGVNSINLIEMKRGVQDGNNAVGCLIDHSSVVLFLLYYLVQSVLVLTLPTVLLVACNMAIIVGLMRASRSRHRLTVRGSERGAGESTVGRSATVTLLLVSLFQCAVFIPFSAVGLLYSLVIVGFIGEPDSTTFTNLIFLYFLFLDFTIYTRLINAFVYYLRIPFFRKSVNFFCCCCVKRRITETESTLQTH